ncbi:MAG: lactate utilization protein C [Treponema sp. GWB1_62_6]|nr:MAG: lactate utilization protein C [Treponema sp. GWC1_61_84]OHE70702.1 MAG: lactate utilization protein C [Treponema sp. GWB1_62_6]HCM25907.1 lactate utilization protein C [Treponema sp.]
MNPTPAVDVWRDETLGESAVKALKKNGFDAVYIADIKTAAEKILSYVGKDKTVGFGGSMTVKALLIAERAKEAGAIILDHNAPGLSPAEKLAIMRRQLTCDVFVSGSNALTLDGEIVNVDGNGNRVAALSFGPAKTVVVMGTNKIVRDLAEAQARIETFAAPMNNKRLDRPNPCVKAGTCQDCSGETRICRSYQVLRRRPSQSDFTVIVVGSFLGY